MDIKNFNQKEQNLMYFIKGYDAGKDFWIIDKLLRNINGVKKIKKSVSAIAIGIKYGFENGEILLITDDQVGTYITIEKKKYEKQLKKIISIIKDIPDLNKFRPFHKKALNLIMPKMFSKKK